MQKTTNTGLVLSASSEARFNSVFLNFAKSDPHHLKFSELMQLLLDRCIFNNKINFSMVGEIFEQATHITVAPKPAATQTNKKQPAVAPPVPVPVVETGPTERHLSKQQLIFFLSELSKRIYQQDPKHLEKMINDIITDKLEADKSNEVEHPRCPTMDELNKKLLVEQSISTLSQHQEDLKVLFDSYMKENYWSVKKDKRMLLSRKEINLQNKRMGVADLVLFLREAQICPHIISIEPVEEMIRHIVPAGNQKEMDFYYKHHLAHLYNQEGLEKPGSPASKHLPNDPGLYFFEFELLLARIAWQSYPKQLQRKGVDSVLLRLLHKVLSLRPNDRIADDIIPVKQHEHKLRDYYHRYRFEQIGPPEKHKYVSETAYLDPQTQMAEKVQSSVYNLPPLNMDLAEVLKALDKELPKLPPKYEPKPQVSSFEHEKVVIGQPVPPEPKEKDEKGGGKTEQKKEAGKKDEIPPRVFKWADPPVPTKSSQDYFQQLASKLAFQTKNLSSIERGTIKIQSLPSLVTEVLFPPEMPKACETHLLSAQNSTIEKNYYLALENYAKAEKQWRDFCKKQNEDMPANAELYFDYMRGSVMMSAGKEDHALLHFYNCRKHSEAGKMGFVNPDRALPYFGIGEVMYEIGEYEMAARCFLKSREIRQNILGVDHIQTANTFLNLGACYLLLDRCVEALGYTEIAEAVFAGELGPYHERTATAKMNLKKINRSAMDNHPEFRKMWEAFEKDEFAGKKKKKKKGDGDKKKK